KVKNLSAFFAHPLFIALEINRPERQIRCLSRQSNTLFASAERRVRFATFFYDGGEKQQRDRYDDHKHLNRKCILCCRSCRKRTIAGARAPYRKKRHRADGRAHTARAETYRRP